MEQAAPAPTTSAPQSVACFWHLALVWCVATLERRRQRSALSQLDDRLLHDVGLTRELAQAEAAKPFWR